MKYIKLKLKPNANTADAMRAMRAISVAIGEEVELPRLDEVIFESKTDAQTIISISWGAFALTDVAKISQNQKLINYSRRRSLRHGHWAAVLGEWKRTVRMVARIGNCRPAVAMFSGRRDCDAEIERLMSHYNDEPISVSFATTDGQLIEEWASQPFWHVV